MHLIVVVVMLRRLDPAPIVYNQASSYQMHKRTHRGEYYQLQQSTINSQLKRHTQLLWLCTIIKKKETSHRSQLFFIATNRDRNLTTPWSLSLRIIEINMHMFY